MSAPSWSVTVNSSTEAARWVAEPGAALDLRVRGALDGGWVDLGFRELVPGELVRPLPQVLRGVEQTRALGERLAGALRPGDLVVLAGPLGAGKTSLTQGIAAALGVRGPVTSPTFVLARVHRGRVPLVHVDAYRLRDSGVLDLDDLDLDTDLPSSVVVVEWGDGVVEGLADSRLQVRLERPPLTEGGVDMRTALVEPFGTRWAATADAT